MKLVQLSMSLSLLPPSEYTHHFPMLSFYARDPGLQQLYLTQAAGRPLTFQTLKLTQSLP